MRATSPRPLTLRFIAILCLCFAGIGVALQGAEPESRSYKVTLEATMKMNVADKELATVAHTEYFYTWQRQAQSGTLILDAVNLKVVQDGNTIQDSSMSREKFQGERNGETTEFEFEKAPPALQAVLKDSFATPLVTLELDEQGKEVSRKVTAGKGAEGLISNGVIANCLLFHPPYPSDKGEWQNMTTVSIGGGNYAKGLMTYKKIDGRPNSYSASGTLVNDKFAKPGSAGTIKNTRHVGVGELTFDPARKEWVAGSFKFDVSFGMFAEDKPVGAAKGVIIMTLETLK